MWNTEMSLSLHRAFRRDTQLAHQLVHIHKIVYIKTFKIIPILIWCCGSMLPQHQINIRN